MQQLTKLLLYRYINNDRIFKELCISLHKFISQLWTFRTYFERFRTFQILGHTSDYSRLKLILAKISNITFFCLKWQPKYHICSQDLFILLASWVSYKNRYLAEQILGCPWSFIGGLKLVEVETRFKTIWNFFDEFLQLQRKLRL